MLMATILPTAIPAIEAITREREPVECYLRGNPEYDIEIAADYQ